MGEVLAEKIKALEVRCPGCSFGVEGEGDGAVIHILEFGEPFVVRREWANLDGEWSVCWFDYELSHRPADVEKAVEQAKNRLAILGADHSYGCRCRICREWWKAVGPDPDTGRCGPWTAEELGLNPVDYSQWPDEEMQDG